MSSYGAMCLKNGATIYLLLSAWTKLFLRKKSTYNSLINNQLKHFYLKIILRNDYV